jgi:hypothetical protein
MKYRTAMLALAAIGGALILLAPDPPPPTPEEKAAAEAAATAKAASDKFQSALIRCENQTESQLADPEGFDPVPYGEWMAIETAEDRHVFAFKARARNAFGALVWAEFQCTVTHDGEYWTAQIEQP